MEDKYSTNIQISIDLTYFDRNIEFDTYKMKHIKNKTRNN